MLHLSFQSRKAINNVFSMDTQKCNRTLEVKILMTKKPVNFSHWDYGLYLTNAHTNLIH